jgi:hypothetical protein
MPLIDDEKHTTVSIVDKLLTETRIMALIDATRLMDRLQVLELQNTNLTDVHFGKLLGTINGSANFFRSLTYRG